MALETICLMAVPLIIDRGIAPWQAMKTSAKAIRPHCFKAAARVVLMNFLVLVPEILADYVPATAADTNSLAGPVVHIAVVIIFGRAISLMAMVIGILYRTIFGPARMALEQ